MKRLVLFFSQVSARLTEERREIREKIESVEEEMRELEGGTEEQQRAKLLKQVTTNSIEWCKWIIKK